MNRKSIVEEKSYKFALRIIKLNSYLLNEKREFILGKQILRCGTSVGANVREAGQAESKQDFIHKLNIALKETSETEYWINLLYDSNIIEKKAYDSLIKDCTEILKLLTSIVKTSRSNLTKIKI